MERRGLSRGQMAARIAQEFEEDWIVNLGIGIPTLCSNYAHDVTFHAENGVIGYGALKPEGEEDLYLVNAGGQYVGLNAGGAIVHHADAFAIIRAGYIDVTVLGSYQVAQNGDFANWRTPGRKGGGIGGAMDLAVGAKRVFIAMEHTTRDGTPRLVEDLDMPATARGVVKMLVTNFGLFDITDDGFFMREIAPGLSPEDVQEASGTKIVVSPSLREVEI